jgi:hypothetical protein
MQAGGGGVGGDVGVGGADVGDGGAGVGEEGGEVGEGGAGVGDVGSCARHSADVVASGHCALHSPVP